MGKGKARRASAAATVGRGRGRGRGRGGRGGASVKVARPKAAAAKPAKRAKPAKPPVKTAKEEAKVVPGRRGPQRATKEKGKVLGDSSEEDEFLVSEEDAEDEEHEGAAEEAAGGEVRLLMEKLLARRVKSKEEDSAEAADGAAKEEGADPEASAAKGNGRVMPKPNKSGGAVEGDEGAEGGANVEYEYLLKWKGLSYIHCEWVDEDVVLRQSQGKSRLQRFLRKQEVANMQRADGEVGDVDDAIPEDFVTVDRVLDEQTVDGKKKYYVKWRALPYADSSWELASDVSDDVKIAEFHARNKRPSDALLKTPPRPSPDEYKTLGMPEFKNGGQLREYQMEGFNWLVSCWFNRQGCILADEMGLGKTIQSVSFLNHLFAKRNVRGPFLVMAPLSTLGHWQREFESWTEMNALVYHGNSGSRAIMQEYEWSYGAPQKGPPFKWHALITTYETILQDANKLRQIDWNVIVVDEAHRLKNRASRLVDELKVFKSAHRVLLTGTPIQNNSLEIWALLNYLEPAKFAREEDFAREFGNITDADTVERLKALLRPYLLRRLKEDVEKSIPPKEETIISVELTRVQKKWYRGMLEQNFSFLSKGTKASNVGNLRNIVMELRKCCNHPYLIKGVEGIETEHIPSGDDALLMQHLVEASGKMVLVDKLLPELKRQGHRVLIFSQMIRVLDILEDYLLAKRWGYERIDGRVRGNDRQQAIDRYSRGESDKFVFLLCTRAGGQGINLTVADTVIIYDSDWNPQNDVQAQARCHRIGQQTEVKVYRLITRATYEQDMFDRASKKLGLDQAILQNLGNKAQLGPLAPTGDAAAAKKGTGGNVLTDMNRKDIDSLLRKGAYDVFNEDDTAADQFTSEDITQILSKRVTVLKTTAADAGPSEFSKAAFANKASFAAEEANEKGDVELDDPDFWKKLMPEASAGADPNIEALPRRRRQTVRYMPGTDSDDSELEDDDSGDEADAKLGPGGKRMFNKGERQRVQRALMIMGWGRWAEIREVAGSRRSVDDVAVFCRKIVLLCWQHVMATIEVDAEDDEKKIADKEKELKLRLPFIDSVLSPHQTVLFSKSFRLLDIFGGEEEKLALDTEEARLHWNGDLDPYGNALGASNDDANEDEPILQTDEYSQYVERNANHIFDRLQLMCEIRDLHDSRALADGCSIPVVGASGSQAIGEWWDTFFDRDLIRGTHKHGYGMYQKMRRDPVLVFLGRSEPLAPSPTPDASRPTSPVGDDNGENPDKTGSKVDDDGDAVMQSTDENPKPAGNSGDKESGAGAGEGKDTCAAEDGITTPEVSPESIAGIALTELRARKWPLVQVLNIRVRKLVRGYLRMRKKAEKQAKADSEQEATRRAKLERRIERESKKVASERAREQRLLVANLQWSKKEKSDFSKYFSVVGAPPLDNDGMPSWELVKMRAGLNRKTAEVVQEYAETYERMCKVVLEADRVFPKNEKAVEMYVTRLGKDHPDAFKLVELEEARVTTATARKWRERKDLLDVLRRDMLCELSDESVRNRIEELGATNRERLPTWWDGHRLDVDIGLLQGIATHGFDSTQTALDHSLPFRNLLSLAVIDYIAKTVEEQKASGIEIDKSIVIPTVCTDVAEADIVRFYPKDRLILTRTKRLIEIVLRPVEAEREKTPAKVEVVEKKSRSAGSEPGPPGLSRDAQLQLDDVRKRSPEDQKRSDAFHDRFNRKLLPSISGANGLSTGTGKKRVRDPVRLGDGIYAGFIGESFESAPLDRMSTQLLRFLKHQKKMHAAKTLHLNLPDWEVRVEEFGGPVYDDATTDGATPAPPPPVRVPKRRKLLTIEEGGTGVRLRESHMYKAEKDEEGNVKFPVRLGVLSIENLGKVDPTRPSFHTDRTIYPIGFRSTREYTSMTNVERTCKYVCEILDKNEDAPLFRVTCMDMPDTPFSSSSPSGCWTNVLTAVRDATPEDRKRLHTNVSGPEYFGLTNPLVQELVQGLEGTEKCSKYHVITFVASTKRHHGRGRSHAARAAAAARKEAERAKAVASDPPLVANSTALPTGKNNDVDGVHNPDESGDDAGCDPEDRGSIGDDDDISDDGSGDGGSNGGGEDNMEVDKAAGPKT